MKVARLVVFLSAVCGWHLAAQTPAFDNSGNGLLKGTYYFREVLYGVGDDSGDLNQADALYGNVTFSGSGTYTMSASLFDSSQGLETGTLSGTYTISASGYGFISNPLLSSVSIYGLVSQQGIFIGSSTDNGTYNDIFIAAPLSSPAPTNATFKGVYWISDTDLSSGSPLGAISELFQLNPDGAGNLGSVTLSGYLGENGATLTTQTVPSVKYSFSNGAASVVFPTSNTLYVTGQKFLYISPDGNFVFGGAPNSWDMFVGVRVASGTPSFGGLYYQAGVDEDDSQLANGFGDLDTYFGAFNAGGGAIVGHQRLADVFNSNSFAIDYSYSDGYLVKSDGTYSTPGMRYVVGADGIRIGSGIGPFLGLNVAFPAPGLSGTGVFLNPQGVVNAASSAPFTAGIAPGELLTLYGTGLSNSTQIASVVPLPTNLAGVQVMINGVAAPIYYVTPGAVSAIVPYSATTAVAQIQVINNGAPSNIVTNFTSATAPGIFTEPEGGLGDGAVLHADYTKVTPASPAQIGETVAVYLTGLGAVIPAVPDGTAAPTNPFSLTTNTITAYVGGVQATIGYAGLAPGLAGLYQVNLTIPAGLTAGENDLDIQGPDSYTSEATIAITTGSTSDSPAIVAPHKSLASRMRGSAKPVLRPKPVGPSDPRRQ